MNYISGHKREIPIAADHIEPVGRVRRSQLVSSFGIGAIVDLEKGSFMPIGLESWERSTRSPLLTISEPRLQAMLNVSNFRLGPPVIEDQFDPKLVSASKAAPAVRFPKWHECPKCHRIGVRDNPFELADDNGRLVCRGHSRPVPTAPVRFVLACRRGHIRDFPWEWWAHRDSESGVCDRPILELGSYGRSASLSDLYVRCKECGSEKSLGDAFRPEVLSGFTCSGNRPWLQDREEGCNQNVRVLQRGASNIYFPIICSSLSIPPASEAASIIIEENKEILDAVPDSSLRPVLEGLAKRYNMTVEVLLSSYRQLCDIEAAGVSLTEKQSRVEEYEALSQNREDPVVSGVIPEFCNQIIDPPKDLNKWFDLIGGVSRLREVRALAGFSRILPYPVAVERVNQAIDEGLISPLSKSPRNWLPAAEIRGEGIFFRFRTKAVDEWIRDNPKLIDRAKTLNDLSSRIAAEHGYQQDADITPRLLLVHSFSHALIRQISVECGYSMSALRERLYVKESHEIFPPANGVLIYTGSPDSEGSLGGLVQLAHPDRIESIVKRTLESVKWCGSDPVCIESDPEQSGERVSGAACHYCLMLPETACERFNRELDRSVLVGHPDNEFVGYFSR